MDINVTAAARAVQTFVMLLVVAVLITAALLSTMTHYGDSSTGNEGYTVGGDTAIAQLGIETRGEPGVFGHLKVPGGVVNFLSADDGLTFCPAGATDAECGA